jgi:hypothetical protein
VLGLGFFIGLMLLRGAFLYLWTLGASERIREKSIHRILNAPLGFFLQVRAAAQAQARGLAAPLARPSPPSAACLPRLPAAPDLPAVWTASLPA